MLEKCRAKTVCFFFFIRKTKRSPKKRETAKRKSKYTFMLILIPIVGGGILLTSMLLGSMSDEPYATFEDEDDFEEVAYPVDLFGKVSLHQHEPSRGSFFSKIVSKDKTSKSSLNPNQPNFFTTLKKRTKRPTVVLFYKKTCPACQRFHQYWNSLVDVLGTEDKCNFVAVDHLQMEKFFGKRGKAGGSVLKFPTMRVLDGCKQVAEYENNSHQLSHVPVSVKQNLEKLHDFSKRTAVSLSDPEKLYELVRFIDEST